MAVPFAVSGEPVRAGGDHDPTEVLAAYWAEGERRLYPLATVDSDAYMEAVKLVRAVADELTGVTTLDELAERWECRSELVAEAIKQAAPLPGPRWGRPMRPGRGSPCAAGSC